MIYIYFIYVRVQTLIVLAPPVLHYYLLLHLVLGECRPCDEMLHLPFPLSSWLACLLLLMIVLMVFWRWLLLWAQCVGACCLVAFIFRCLCPLPQRTHLGAVSFYLTTRAWDPSVMVNLHSPMSSRVVCVIVYSTVRHLTAQVGSFVWHYFHRLWRLW